MSVRLYSIIILICSSLSIFAQNTVGLISYDPMKAFDGYNLIYPHNQPNVYLLNNCGEIVHRWVDDENWRPGNTAYLLEDGSILKSKRDAIVTDDAIWAGGGGEILEIRDWDNNLVWSYTLNDEKNRFHHDMTILPNGNIIAIAWEMKTLEECKAAGRDTAKIAQGEIWSDYLLEINPSTNEIVWEWHVWDHLIQDFDSTANNYGVVEDHPELIDINYDTRDGHPDWIHANSVDYSEMNSQILLSTPYFDEVWIIDHTTSTEEAAGSSGGFSNRGGDLMWRWGNPITYRAGTIDDQRLFFQHDAHFIDGAEISFTNPFFNDIAVFNNEFGDDFSSINIIKNTFDMYTWDFEFDANQDQPFSPQDYDFSLTHPEPQKIYSTGLSSVQLLPNDNFLVTSGRFGYSVEMTQDQEVVWEYVTPIVGGAPASQGDSLSINNNLTFRMDRYPTDYSAFTDRDLSSKGFIELDPNTTFCDELLDLEFIDENAFLNIYPNPASSHIVLEWDVNMYTQLEIFNNLGQRMSKVMKTGGRTYVEIGNWPPGKYVVLADGKLAARFIKVD